MNRKVKLVLVGVGTVSVAAVGTAVAASYSYVTEYGRGEARWGVRVFNRLGIPDKLTARQVRRSDREQGIPLPLRRYVDSLEGEARKDFIDQHNDKRLRSGLPAHRF
jgi:hypothetical protein